jgi:hypothetical protein
MSADESALAEHATESGHKFHGTEALLAKTSGSISELAKGAKEIKLHEDSRRGSYPAKHESQHQISIHN